VKILLVHNHYLQPGGEDQVFLAEAEALRAHGEDVRLYTLHNQRIATMGQLALARSAIWNPHVFADLTALLQGFTPDIVHCHNTFPLISPSAYAAARQFGIPVVQTLHNFRLLCVNGLLFRDQHQCEDCVGRMLAWPGVVHACYRGSRAASTLVALMLGVHKMRGTWRTAVDTYITLSQFARAKFVAGGLPSERIVVKPNFLPRDPGVGAHEGRFALYVGRLSPEKGIATLLRLWNHIGSRFPLRIIGSGPLEALAISSGPGIEWLGWQPHGRVLAAMKDASFLVFPSEWYEGFPMVVLEAMATGLPVISNRHGAMPEIVGDGDSGVLVPSGRFEEWIAALEWAIGHPEQLAAMGRRGREVFEANYCPEAGYHELAQVYQHTIGQARAALTSSHRLP
jgi:glycosyltransferase involved in cell wall biosynthesis